MDKYNVISITSNLDELENDMTAWSNLPIKFRMRSNEECIRRYNMTNIDLFNKLKAAIVSNQPIEDEEILLGKNVSMNEAEIQPAETSYMGLEERDFRNKVEQSNQLQQSPLIVIINPFYKNTEPEYRLEDLELVYNKYLSLNPKNRKLSNSYSMSLWNYNVPNMYNYMKSIIIDKYGTEDDKIIDIGNNVSSVIESSILPINDDQEYSTLDLIKTKLDACDPELDRYGKAVFNTVFDQYKELNFDEIVSNVTPFFTLDEMAEFGYNDIKECTDYYSTISSKMKEFEETGSEELEKEIISYGWNPSVEFNKKNIEFARQRQCKWLSEKAFRIIDLTKANVECINETSSNMAKLYDEKNIYPVYIVLSARHTFVSNTVTKVTKSNYAHVAIGLNSDLSSMGSFRMTKNVTGNDGFFFDSLKDYYDRDPKFTIEVLAVFVNKQVRNIIAETIAKFAANMSQTRYNYSNLIKILIKKSEVTTPEMLSMVCSQFVDTVLRAANINLFVKSSNLVTPGDFDKCNNPKLFKIYEGLGKEYNEKRVEAIIKTLLKREDKKLLYNDAILEICKYNLESFFCNITDNSKANAILESYRELLTPTVICERKLPIGMNKDGDLIIRLYKSLEDEYQEAHRLLKQYENTNIEGIKHELARLYYINYTIEKKIKKMKKDNPNYKKFIDLRARVLNDFKKYFKIVIKADPNFDFAEYFKTTEYFTGNIIVDNALLKFTGKLIKDFLISLGLLGI